MNRHKSSSSISLTASNINLNFRNPQNLEKEELIKQLNIKNKLINKIRDIAPDGATNKETNEQLLHTLKIIQAAKHHGTGAGENIEAQYVSLVKEYCSKLNDYGICATYLLAESRKSSHKIHEILSPYILKNLSDIEYIRQYIPEKYIEDINKKHAIELLTKPVMKEYLDQKVARLEKKSPLPSTTEMFKYDGSDVEARENTFERNDTSMLDSVEATGENSNIMSNEQA